MCQPLKMDYKNIRVAELKAIARELGLRGYSRLRKGELIALLRDNLQPPLRQAPRPREPHNHRPRSGVQAPVGRSQQRPTQPRQPSVRFRPDRPRQPELLRKLEERTPQPPPPPRKRPQNLLGALGPPLCEGYLHHLLLLGHSKNLNHIS